MSKDCSKYSVSLIRMRDNSWLIDPSDTFLHSLYKELPTQLLGGNSYLAVKTMGGVSFYIFLGGEVCHSDLCGWIITLDGRSITDIDKWLQHSRGIWVQLRINKRGYNDPQALCDIIREKELSASSLSAKEEKSAHYLESFSAGCLLFAAAIILGCGASFLVLMPVYRIVWGIFVKIASYV